MDRKQVLESINGQINLPMKVIWLMEILMEKESTNGKTVVNMMVNGYIIKSMVMENISGQMGKFIKEILLRIRKMGMANCSGQMEENIRDNGKKVNNMETERLLKMVKNIEVYGRMANL